LLIDADGLNAHVGALDGLRERAYPTVLTPHEGELGRLLEAGSDEIAAHRLARAREAAERSGAYVLLKGDDTIVAAPGGPVAISPAGRPRSRRRAPATSSRGSSERCCRRVSTRSPPPAPACSCTQAPAGTRARHFGADHTVAGTSSTRCRPAFAETRGG